MVGNCYRLTKSTVGVRESKQGQVLHKLLTDSMVSVHSLSEDGRSVQVDAAEVSLTLFTQDLVRFATLVASATKATNFAPAVPSLTATSAEKS